MGIVFIVSIVSTVRLPFPPLTMTTITIKCYYFSTGCRGGWGGGGLTMITMVTMLTIAIVSIVNLPNYANYDNYRLQL